MSLLCNKKNNPTNEQLENQKLLRDIGLSPVNNVYVDVNMCLETIDSFTYSMTGATKGDGPLDINSMSAHNLNDEDFVSLVFDIDDGYDYLSYDGVFCFTPIPTTPYVNQPITRCVEFKNIDESGVFGWDLNELIKSDYQYTVSTKSSFVSKCMTNSNGVSGTTMVDGPVDSQYYFVTVVNPPEPRITSDGDTVLNDVYFVNEKLVIESDGSNMFELSAEPLGLNVVVVVNGINLSVSDYTVDGNLIKLSDGLFLNQRDSITAYYTKSVGVENGLTKFVGDVTNLDVFSVDEISELVFDEGETTYENIVNDNVEAGRLEIYLKDDIDYGIQPVLSINGVDLVYNTDFYKSSKVNNKLVLAEGIVVAIKDVVSVFYYKTTNNSIGDLGILLTDQPEIKWTLDENLNLNNGSYGVFHIEICDKKDKDFTNILLTDETLYINGTIDYNYKTKPITTKDVSDYIYRIRFDKTFVDSNGFEYVTSSYSTTVRSFSIDWDYISNTNV